MSIYDTIRSSLDQGKRGVLATIVRRVGATPRDAGAKIFIEEGGKLFGTIGGGCVEAEAWQEAQTVLQSDKPTLLHYAMNGRQVEDEGMICGGSIDILMEPVLARHKKSTSLFYRRKGAAREELLSPDLKDRLTQKHLLDADGAVTGDEAGSRKPLIELQATIERQETKPPQGLIIEPVVPSSVVYIYGAGHISQSISKIAKMVGFYVIVIDDRRDFANQERFPEADEIIVDDFDFVSQHLPTDSGALRSHRNEGAQT